MKRALSILLAMLWSFAVIVTATAGDRVWCVGADGHARVEKAIGTECAADSHVDPVMTKSPILTGLSDHCGPCSDMSLASDTAQLSAAKVSLPAPVAKIVPPSLLAALLAASANPDELEPVGILREAGPPTPWLLAHKTVVLLI